MSKRILIVRLSAVGDVVQGTPVARQLRQQHPDWHLTWLVQQKALAGIANNPWLDEIKVMPDYDARSVLRVWRELRGRYDVTLDLQCLAKSAAVTWGIHSPLRIGRESARESAWLAYNHRTPVSGDYRYVSQCYLEECLEFGVDINDYVPELHPSDEDQATAERLFGEHGLGDGRPVVALIAFTAEPTRAWPAERFATVGDRLAEEHGAVCLIPGARGERAAAEALAARMRHRPVVLAGQTGLGAAAAVLQRCRLAIGADTGLTHYAFAVGTPLICLLGPSPMRNGPTSDTAITLASACEYRPCQPRRRCRRGEGRPCLLEIGVDEVLEAARGLLAGVARR
ncbi:MAG: glycosyltransferase family 9 protein [Armatimonadetes bacterium]|nr:glycosyltransferase family 9 protein [Armatimonadota bacterium]